MQVISSMYKTEAHRYANGVDRVFRASMKAVTKEVHPQMIMSQRGQMLMNALSASISAGRKDSVVAILGIDNISSYLEDQGESVSQVLAEAICNSKTSEASSLAVGVVWESIMQRHMYVASHILCAVFCHSSLVWHYISEVSL